MGNQLSSDVTATVSFLVFKEELGQMVQTAPGGIELGIKTVTTHLGFVLSICTTSLGQTVMGDISLGKTVICGFFPQLNLLSIAV